MHQARITEMFSISIVAKASSLHALKHKGYSSYPQKKEELQRVQPVKPPMSAVADMIYDNILFINDSTLQLFYFTS